MLQAVYHLGVHCTDDDRLLKCLLQNKDKLASDGIIVPNPKKYRDILREAMITLRGKPAPIEMQEQVLDAALDNDDADRIIFSNPAFLCAPARILQNGRLYSQADEKSQWLSQILPGAACEFHIGIRNPATLIPAVFNKCKVNDFADFLGGVDPFELLWSDVIARIRSANPDAAITVWCNEDTPLIWPEILREMSGHDPFLKLDGTDDFLATIMTKAGLKRLQDYLADNPPANEMQRRRVVAAFLDKFALEDEVEEELDLPGWTEELVEDMTEIYEEDLFAVERIEGVHVITP